MGLNCHKKTSLWLIIVRLIWKTRKICKLLPSNGTEPLILKKSHTLLKRSGEIHPRNLYKVVRMLIKSLLTAIETLGVKIKRVAEIAENAIKV